MFTISVMIVPLAVQIEVKHGYYMLGSSTNHSMVDALDAPIPLQP